MKRIIILTLILLCNILHAEETQDSKWQVGSFKPAIDKQAHFLGGFGAYSMIERVTDKRVAQYGFILLIAGAKETMDSWRTVGDFADMSYSLAGAMSCDLLLSKLNLKSDRIKIDIRNNRMLLAINW